MKLSIIIVNYNAGRTLGTCLSSIARETKDISYEVILVDNCSTDGSVEVVEKDFPDVKLIRNSENRGFAAANNIAVRNSAGEFILLLNPDTEILDGAIQKTVAFMESNPRVGVAGCKLLYPDRTLQPSVRPFPSVSGAFLEATFLYLLIPSKKVVRRRGIPNFDSSREAEVDWVIGAYFMMRRSVVERIGLLDEQFWIYGEEIDYCQRAKNAGFETWFIPHAAAVHHYGGMTSYTLRGIVWIHVGYKLYVHKHYRGARRLLLEYLKYLGIFLRAVLYPLAGCLTLNRRLFPKAYYYGVALYKVLTKKIEYVHGYAGKVEPWTKYI